MEQDGSTTGRMIASYRDPRVWKDAMSFAETCYATTAQFLREEVYGLTAQIRRAAASIAANIAEGHGRERTASFVQFLRIAQGSLKELETHVILSERLRCATPESVQPILLRSEILGKRLRSLIRSLQARTDAF